MCPVAFNIEHVSTQQDWGDAGKPLYENHLPCGLHVCSNRGVPLLVTISMRIMSRCSLPRLQLPRTLTSSSTAGDSMITLSYVIWTSWTPSFTTLKPCVNTVGVF